MKKISFLVLASLLSTLSVSPVLATSGDGSHVLEYLYNGVDDDGDGVIDEFNTIAENGDNSSFVSVDPNDTAAYSRNVVKIAGGINGEILVYFSDNSAFRYKIFDVSTTRFTSVSSLDGTANLYVSLGRYRAVVVAYTGNIVASTKL